MTPIATIAEIAHITAPCRHCARRFHPRPAQILNGESLYCSTCIRPQCQACQHSRATHPVYGLHLCPQCRVVAYSSCWRKGRYAADPGTTNFYDDGHPLYGYWCPLCQGWHLTKIRDVADIPADYLARQAQLADLMKRLGWRVEDARAAHHSIPMEDRNP